MSNHLQGQAFNIWVLLIQGDEPRTVQAAGILLKQGICKLTMLGDSKKIKELAEEFHVDLSLATLIDPSKSENLEKYAQLLYESRKHKVHMISLYSTCTTLHNIFCMTIRWDDMRLT